MSDAAAGHASPTIDRNAPVLGWGEIVVAAPPETVWDLLAAIEGWPSWNPDVKSASVDGAVASGTQFRWKSGATTITSTLQHLERPRQIAWSGRTFGLKAFHVWQLEPKDGSTLVLTEEIFEGLIARIFRRRLRRTVSGALENGLRHLKAEAERRAER